MGIRDRLLGKPKDADSKAKTMAERLAELALALQDEDKDKGRARAVATLDATVECERCQHEFKLSSHCTQEDPWYFKFTCPKCALVTGVAHQGGNR